LLFPFRDPARVRNDYPLFLFAPDRIEDDHLYAPLADLLKQLTDGIARGGEDAQLLKDNLPRLERYLRDALTDTDSPVDATTLLADAAKAVEKELSLSGDAAQRLHKDLEKLLAALPDGGKLLSLGEHTAVCLLIEVVRHRVITRHARLRNNVADLAAKLRDVLRIDDAKTPKGHRAEAIGGTVGDSAAHFDAEALARVLGPARGAEPMEAIRRARLDEVAQILGHHLSRHQAPRITVVNHDKAPSSWQAEDVTWQQVGEADVCRAAWTIFDDQAAQCAQLFGAIRVARLELAGAYDPVRHDALLESFDWRAFSPQEMLCVPPVLAVASAEDLATTGMLDLSRILLSARPVRVMVTVQPSTNPGLAPDDDPLTSGRFELAYLGVSHREALVHQSAAARPEHLLDGFLRGLDATGCSLHVVAGGLTSPGQPLRLGSYLHVSAALEGRAHPLFLYDPQAGATWARRFEFAGNPQPQADWPVYDMPCRDAQGREQRVPVAFTFADSVLPDARYRDHFRVAPARCGSEKLIPISEYLTLLTDDANDRIPFVWATDERGQLHRVVISRDLTWACQDRLDYWRTLQELAGVRNEYVREAVACERERLEAEFEAERQQLAEAHADVLERVRTEASRDAMQRLAAALVATDASSLTAITVDLVDAPVASPATAGPAPIDAEPAQETDAPIAEDDDDEPSDPWINSILCTSCNDCMAINPQVFVYNANKQATIGDPRAGTYVQLVQAAEKCPAKCIHPGTPLNPEEPGLKELIERAKPFK